MPSNFKRYRQAFTQSPQSFDPSRILTNAMQSAPEPVPTNGPGPQSPRTPPTFGLDTTIRHDIPDFGPRIREADRMGRSADLTKQYHRDQGTAMLQGFAQGLANSGAGNPDVNFGQAFAAGLGASAGVTRGSMQQIEDRRSVEEARAQEIENTFFNRSVKLQELRIRREQAAAEAENARVGRELQRQGIDASNRRADIAEDRLSALERHNVAMEDVARTNANANVTRAGAAQKSADAATIRATNAPKPKSPGEIDEYARSQVYRQYGVTDENGVVIDQEKKARIDRQLNQVSTTRRNPVQQAYDRYRGEATKSNVSSDEAGVEEPDFSDVE